MHKETWDYDFKQEGTVRDCEQSFLSQMILKEIEFRKARDEEHKFHDIFKYTDFFWTTRKKIPYRDNIAVLPISVSEKQTNRALRIMNTFNLVSELGGKVIVNRGDKDNTTFMVFNNDFSFDMNEIMIKQRTKLLESEECISKIEFKPIYERLHSSCITKLLYKLLIRKLKFL